MGTFGQPGYVFRDFCLKLGIDFISFCLKQGIFSWTINSRRVCYTNVLEFCLKQGRKISDFCLKQGQGMRGRAAPPYPRIYRVPPPPREYTPLPEIKRVSYTLFKRQRGKRYLVERCIPVKSVYMGPYISPPPPGLAYPFVDMNLICVRTLNLFSYERMRSGLA